MDWCDLSQQTQKSIMNLNTGIVNVNSEEGGKLSEQSQNIPASRQTSLKLYVLIDRI